MLSIVISTDGGTFDQDPMPEIRRLLEKVTAGLDELRLDGELHDTNGNRCGSWSYRP